MDEADWSLAAPEVRKFLRRLGVKGPDVDDLCQDVAVVALGNRTEFPTQRDWLGWCCGVARNLARGQARVSGRCLPLDGVDVPSGADVEAEVTANALGEALGREIAQLSEQDRIALLLPRGVASDRSEQLKLASRRRAIRLRLSLVRERHDHFDTCRSSVEDDRGLARQAPQENLTAISSSSRRDAHLHTTALHLNVVPIDEGDTLTYNALPDLQSAGISLAPLNQDQRDVLAALSDGEVRLLVALKARLETASEDLVTHAVGDKLETLVGGWLF